MRLKYFLRVDLRRRAIEPAGVYYNSLKPGGSHERTYGCHHCVAIALGVVGVIEAVRVTSTAARAAENSPATAATVVNVGSFSDGTTVERLIDQDQFWVGFAYRIKQPDGTVCYGLTNFSEPTTTGTPISSGVASLSCIPKASQ